MTFVFIDSITVLIKKAVLFFIRFPTRFNVPKSSYIDYLLSILFKGVSIKFQRQFNYISILYTFYSTNKQTSNRTTSTVNTENRKVRRYNFDLMNNVT